ncbi:MAG: phosphoenolpyruvate synthase [Bacillota bacterium]|nr:phosphoenolpyruvate synthase [Bacillota bacterium]
MKVIDFSDPNAQNISLSGGKGASLARLSHIGGVKVPSGFIITTENERVPTEKIMAELARFPEGTLFAVRSSATAEDLPDASFAGQMDSFLNVSGYDAILSAVEKCRASLYSERAVSYREKNNISAPKMAVVVQEMVQAKFAGVMFTADPVSSDRRTTVIEAVEGLGEELVSGRKTPETYKIKDGNITGSRTFLTDEQIKKLVSIGKIIEKEYGNPQDIEWCLAKGEFHIVQARGITTLFPLPERKDDKNHIYMSFSHQQMMTDAIKPLGMHLFLTLGTNDKLQILSVGGRMYGDLSADLASFVSKKIVLATFGQSDPLSVGAIKNLLGRKEFMKNIARGGVKFFSLNAGYFTLDFFRQLFVVSHKNDAELVPRLMEKMERGNQELAEQLEKLSGNELFEFIKSYQKRLRKDLYESESMAAVMASVLANLWINKHIENWLGEKNVADILTQSAPYNITSEMGHDLLDVADIVRKYPDQTEALKNADDDTFFDGLNAEVAGAIRKYLNKYGMRCTGEIDITRPRFYEKPTMLIPLILSNVQNFETGARGTLVEKGLKAYKQKEQELLKKVGRLRGRKLKKKISILRNFAGFREYPKYFLICRYWLFKKALMKEAYKLMAAGVICDREDVYYLTFLEFQEAVNTGKVDLRVIEQRKSEHAYFEKLTPPRIMTSDGENVSGEYTSTGYPKGSLLGVPVSSGTVQGRARVITKLEHAVFEKGDILVTKYTDPSWTPAFVSIKGLVTEVGGTMTHGAVIAREYGLPAVVSVENATKLIKDGQIIRVNGTEGFIEILEQ